MISQSKLGFFFDQIKEFFSDQINNLINNEAIEKKEIMQIYDRYEIQKHFVMQATSEDSIIGPVQIFDHIDQLKKKMIYLYVVTTEGAVWFSPRSDKDQRITHAALLRKATHIDNDQVLASGEISIDSIDNNSVYINLSSGHFLPKIQAYSAAIISLAPQSKSKPMYISWRFEDSLDESSAQQINSHYYENAPAYIHALLTDIKKLQLISKADISTLDNSKLILRQDAPALILIENKIIANFKDSSQGDLSKEELEIISRYCYLIELLNNNKSYCSDSLLELLNNKNMGLIK